MRKSCRWKAKLKHKNSFYDMFCKKMDFFIEFKTIATTINEVLQYGRQYTNHIWNSQSNSVFKKSWKKSSHLLSQHLWEKNLTTLNKVFSLWGLQINLQQSFVESMYFFDINHNHCLIFFRYSVSLFLVPPNQLAQKTGFRKEVTALQRNENQIFH